MPFDEASDLGDGGGGQFLGVLAVHAQDLLLAGDHARLDGGPSGGGDEDARVVETHLTERLPEGGTG